MTEGNTNWKRSWHSTY